MHTSSSHQMSASKKTTAGKAIGAVVTNIFSGGQHLQICRHCPQLFRLAGSSGLIGQFKSLTAVKGQWI